MSRFIYNGSLFGVWLCILALLYRRIVPNSQDSPPPSFPLPSLSILIPLYNDEQYVLDCLESILQQSFTNFEIIIVDDGSTDSSGRLADWYSYQDERVHSYHHLSNQGSLIARKTAVQYATKDYCIFVDADDYLPTPTTLENLMRLTITNEDIIQFSIMSIGNATKQERRNMLQWFKPFRRKLSGAPSILNHCFSKSHYCWNLCGKLFRTKVCKMGFSHVKEVYSVMAEDAYAFFLIAFHANSYRGITTHPFYAYRYGPGISNGNEMDLGRYSLYTTGECMMVRMIEEFLRDNDSQDIYFLTLQTLKRRVIDGAKNRRKQLKKADQEEGLKIFRQCLSDLE